MLLVGVPVSERQPAAALARDSRAWLLAKRDNHVELEVVVRWRLLWEETVALKQAVER